jgi:hypothetical protein
MVYHNQVKAHLYQDLTNNRDHTHVLQSPSGIIRTSFRLQHEDSLASMNTQAKQEQIKALYSSMKTTSELIDVSLYAPSYLLTLRTESFLMQVVVKHSRDKDQFLRVSLKRMQETQMFETELKEANEYISALFAHLKELEDKCTMETRIKEGKILLPFQSCKIVISEYTLD